MKNQILMTILMINLFLLEEIRTVTLDIIKSQTLFNDACYCVERNLDLDLDTLDYLIADPDLISLPNWVGLNALKLVKTNKYHAFNGSSILLGVCLHAKKLINCEQK